MNYDFTDILTLLGSLGLFLYGMKVMSEALVKLAGNRMRSILAATTSNRVFALLTGFLITATVQSSSATTLMVVSFVNANLLTLTEAVGVIMGANIGTTVTAWLISILGFKVKMSAIAIPLVGLGFVLSLAKDHQRKNLGLFIVGFAILFIGLEFLKDSVPDIRNNPEVLAFLAEYTTRGYLSVLLFMVIGTVLTLIVQSSSATMALTILMTYEGWIPFDMAAAMVLGENIGTTITANLAALVANFNAKRAARAHLIFNCMGVLWVLALFYPFINIVAEVVTSIEGSSPFYTAIAIPVALSLFHTSFNILNALFLIGFVTIIVRIVEKVVPEEIEPEIEIAQAKFLTEESMKYSQTGIKSLFDESMRLLENTAYKIIAHGMSVHREDLDSEKSLTKIIEDSTLIPIDIDQIYTTQVKSIYSQILEYATRLQSSLDLSSEEVETIRNILIADRKLVQVVKNVKPLRENIEHYMDASNEDIRREYNLLRHRILKVTRMIHRLARSDRTQYYFEKLQKQRSKAKQLDVLRNGKIDKLVLNQEITREMATSLMNDSMNAIRLTHMLIDVAVILYIPKDQQVSQIEENIPANSAVNLDQLMNEVD